VIAKSAVIVKSVAIATAGMQLCTATTIPLLNHLSGPPAAPRNDEDEEGARNSGSNLFVTGIHPSLTEEEVTRLFEKYGEVEQCNIMRDPHTKESRGFGFVKMVTSDQADAAKEGLQGEVHQGRTLSIEKARRARPRTPTPGKYYGPPKRGKYTPCSLTVQITDTCTEFGGRGGGGPRGGGGYRSGDRYSDDRRGGYGRRDDYGSRSSRYDDRGYGGGSSGGGGYGGSRRDDYGPRGVDRYASDRGYSGGRDSGRDDRRGGGGGYYDRPPPPAAGAGSYDSAPPPREAYSGGRSYEGDYDRSYR
jgi:transformer-2 protein